MTFLLAFWRPIALGIAVIALVAAVGFAKQRYDEGKREDGRTEVRTEWEAAKVAALAANTAQEQRWQVERDAREKAEKELDDERSKRAALAADAARRLPDRVARVVVPRESIRVLNSAIDAGNPAPAPRSARDPAKAAPSAAEGADSNIGLLTQWGVQCIALYDEARGMVAGWQRFYGDLRAAQPKDAP